MSSPHRIVSLIASGTEIVAALGFGDELVGRSHECDFPTWVERLPPCSEPRIDIHASSGEIDRQVRATVTDAISVYRVFTDELNRLQPTHIVTQSQCEVCAVSLKDVRQAVCELVGSQPEIIALEPMDLKDIWNDIQMTAAALDAPERGTALVADCLARLEHVRSSVAGRPGTPTVVCLEWLEPLMSAGNWVPELVELAGGEPVLCEAGKHSPYFTWKDLVAADPGVIAIMPCGFDIPRTISELGVLFDRPEWYELRAVRQGRVYITDGNQYFNRPGPRVVESAEILAELLHDPGRNLPGTRHHKTGWLRLEEC
ncbi:cobalamin-binding protein [Planctomicrobium piriforme]|uniref:Iron complex transport system substrate-binding protein n=1 Tax=Planctomicrobium piriforme TaxID=1576369 RepID=A0A1I3J543_9PLAN|nr:cobalamin-binding protein [Planctomicrobium piriforme]SFI55444.1 iron complex transport system substrate-binding protein [Planctomicrobium piriforme]